MKNHLNRSFCSLRVRIFLLLMGVFCSLDGFSQDISFTPSLLNGLTLNKPTSLQFGPDGRLYVSQQDGTIRAYTINKTAPNEYTVTATETILLVKNIPNHNDDGSLNTQVITRQVTGILLAGTAENPVLYVGSSDPRIGGGGTGGDKNLDTNSGIISRLTKNGGVWTKIDLVRGLPRSEENHANNGMQLDEVSNILYVASGGSTNAGAPSNNFAFITEYALSAAILAIDLNVIESMPVRGSGNNQYIYDLPTLDDPTRSNINNPDHNAAVPGSPETIDANDPFGGNDGLNQAKLIVGGPVQIYSPGYRNIYDLVITTTPGREGRMYTIDNGPNGGWGGHPENEGAFGNPLTTNVTNNYVVGEPGSSGPGPNDAKVNNLDNLHLVSAPGMLPIYAGHPNPIRANPGGAGLYWFDNNSGTAHFSLNPTVDWPPVPLSMANPVEGDYRNPGVNDGALLTFGSSTNGLAEYTASNYFGGALTGELITALYDGSINRIKLNAAGTGVISHEVLASGFGNNPLDVICQGNNDKFPGTIWVATYGSSTINIFEPNESLSWQDLISSDGSLPQARHENAYVEAGGKFYLIGGRGDRDLDIYDPLTNKWTKGTKPPLQFHHFQAVTVNGLIYVVGAFVGSFPAETPVANIYIYNPAANTWAQGPLIPENRRRGAAGAVVYNNKIYLVCGIQNGHESGWVPWLDVFDPATNTWTQLPDAPRARDHFQAAVLNNQIFNIAGRRSGEDGFLFARTVAEVDVFDLITNTWKTLPASANIPTQRAGTSAAILESEILIVGGETSQTVAHNQTEAFNVLLNTWRTLAPLNTGRHATQIVTYGGKFYITAGSGNRGGTPELNSQEIFTFNQHCTGDITNFSLDDDNDGYSNGDETDNGTNPCSAASIPPDFNGNFISDLNDPDDDSDGVMDENDAFARDTDNGLNTNLPIDYAFLNGDPGTGLFGLGFTGLMTNGVDNYLDQYDANHPDLIMGGAVGLASFPASQGDALTNDQKYAFQFGVNVNDMTQNFTVESQILGPFFNEIPLPELENQTVGIYIGNGDQNNYLKIVLAANNGNPGIQIIYENNGVVAHNNIVPINNILLADEINLKFKVDAANGIVQPQYFSNVNPGDKNVGAPIALTGVLKNIIQGPQAMAVGLIASSGNADPFLVSYNFIKINSPSPSIANPIADVSQTVNSGSLNIDLSNVFTDDGGIENLTFNVQSISNPALVVQTSITGSILTVEFAPGLTGSSEIIVRATDEELLFAEDHFTVTINNPPVVFIRLNSGGPQVTFNNEIWQLDQYATGGTVYQNVVSIEGTENDAIYQTERHGVYNYEIPLAAGTYNVRLHFAEIFYGVVSTSGVGARIFNVDIENGQAKFLNYDIFEKAGGARIALQEDIYGIDVSDNFLTIALSKVKNNPKLSAIEIWSTTAPENVPPVVTNPGDQSYQEGAAVSLQIQASDLNAGDVITFSATGLPTSLLINTNTGLITGTIEANAGEYLVIVKATDQGGLFDEESFTIVITEPSTTNLPPLVTNPGNQIYMQGAAVSLQIAATDPNEGDVITFSATGLPPSLLINSNTGLISGTIVANPGEYAVTVKASDAAELYDEESFTITVTDPPVGSQVLFAINSAGPALTFNAETWQADQFASAGSTYTKVLAIAGTENDQIYHSERYGNFSYNIPIASGTYIVRLHFAEIFYTAVGKRIFNVNVENISWLTNYDIFSDVGYATATWKTTEVSVADGMLTLDFISVKNNAKISAIEVISVSGGNNPPTLANSIPDQLATEGAQFNFTFAANTFADADGDPLVYSASRSNDTSLPGWLTFNGLTRTFSGTPLAADVSAIDIKVTASDGHASVSDIFNLTVQGALNNPPIVANAIPDQLATEGAGFNFTFAANTFADADGDPLAYTASLSNDISLPGWLNFNGLTRTFSGTPGPADVGAIDIKVTATDGQAAVSDVFNLTVEGVVSNNPPVVANAIPDQLTAEGSQFNFTFATNTFADADGDPLAYSASLSNDASLPGWLSFDGLTRSFSGTPGAADVGAIDIKVTASDGQAAVSDVFQLTVQSAGEVAFRVNVGGNNFTSTEGILFAQDQFFEIKQSATGYSNRSVVNTTESILYQSFRNGDFNYNFPVVNGSYRIVLHFNEVWDGKITGKKGIGTRLFNVKAEGLNKLTNYDVFAKAGSASSAVVEFFDSNVSDEMLNLEFIPVKNGAIVSAIEVIPIGANANTAAVGLNLRESSVTYTGEERDIELYPNPVDDVIYLEFIGKYDENISVIIYDQLGKQYLSSNPILDFNRLEIELTDLKLSRGIYHLKISSAEYTEIIKFVKN